MRGFWMTWRHFLRTLVVAVLGAVALALATHARAEGGEGPSVVSPQEIESAQATASVAGPDESVAEAGKTEKTASRKGAKPAVRSAATDEEAGAESVSGSAPRVTGRVSDAARAGALKPLIVRFASENSLPYELADAVVRIESRYNARARNGGNLGLSQVNLRTAQSLGYKGDAAGLLDAETNLQYGLRYLAKAYSLAGGDTCGTILRYQFGHRTQAMTAASRAYCARVKTIIAAAE
jgi:soluble lytic murein transglycosylase-like protein